jgi:hypothetical protein
MAQIREIPGIFARRGWRGILQAAPNLGLTVPEALELGQLVRLHLALTKICRPKRATRPKRLPKGETRRHDAPLGPPLGDVKDANTRPVCSLCGYPVPHSTPGAWKAHNYQAARSKGWKKRANAIRRGGTDYERFHGIKVAAQVAKSDAKRLQIFLDTAPRAAAVLGTTKILTIIGRYPRRRALSIWRRWVELHYGGSIAKRNSWRSLRGLDQAVWNTQQPGTPGIAGPKKH